MEENAKASSSNDGPNESSNGNNQAKFLNYEHFNDFFQVFIYFA